MSNFFEIECSINDNPNNLEIINYDVNEIVINPCLPTTPSDYIDIINGQINNFIFSGSGINLIPTSTGLYIESELFGGSGIVVSENSGTYTINTDDSYINNLIKDGFNTNLAAGSGIIFSYDNDILYLNSIIQAGKDIGITNQSGIYTVAFTGVYPSGDFSLVGHQHLSTDITDFDSAVSGLLPVVNGSGYINSSFNNNTYTISVSGLQPSGNYSLVGHTHMSSDVSDFNSSVSGILPVKNIFGGNGILVTSSGSDFTVAVTGQFGLTGEEVDDRVSNLLVAGDYINLNYNDLYDTLNIAVTGLQPSGNYSLVGHSHTSSDIIDFNTSVSGLIPPQSITSLVGISGIIVTNSGSAYTVSLSDPVIQLSDISDLSSDAQTFLLTPSSNNLQNLVSDETGSGSLVFNDSPNFSGVPTAPTAPSGTNTNQIASTQFVRSEIANLVDSAPSTLDTLNELAAALGDDANFSTTITNSLAGKANLSGATFTGPVVIPSGTGNFNSLTVNNIDVSISGHTHVYTDITNFGSGVSNSLTTTLLPGSFIALDYNSALDTLTISASGLQPSGNYSVVGHTHTSSNITDFNSSVSGLLPVKNVLGSGYINISSSSGVYTVTATGLQPSGNYSLVGHTHLSTDITDSTSFGRNILTAPSYDAQNKLSWQIVNNNITAAAGGQYLLTTNAANPATLTISDPLSPSNGDWYVVIKPSGAGGVFGGTVIGGVSYASASGVYLYRVYSADSIFSSSWKTYTLDKLHNHIASDITDFNSSVSGLLPVKDIVSGSGIGITSSSGIYTISSTVNEVAQAASLVTTVFNKTGSPIPKMSAVYVNGGQGDMPTVTLAIATSDMTSAGTYGLAYETINNMSSGKVIVFGALTGLNTDQFNPTSPHGDVNGTVLYLSPTTSGLITKTKPSAPDHIVAIGTIVRTHQNQGVIEVRIQNGFELDELHNVAISGVTNGQFLQYNSASQLWVPSSSGNFSTLQVNGTGVSLSGHTHTSSSIADFNSSVSGLLPSVSGSGYVSSNFINNIYTISVSGLQPSGDYSLSGHTHTASNITDFNSSVSGLLPVTSIIGGTNISVVPSGSEYTISVSGSLGLTTEEVDDRVSNLLVAGSGISLDYNDGLDTLTIHNTSISPDEIEEYATYTNLPASGNINILYRTTDDARLYQWSGSFYAEIGPDSVTTGSHASQHYTNGVDPILNVVSRPVSLTANVNNYAHNNADIIYLNADANRVITGLIAATDGTVKLLVNGSLYTITLDHQDTNSNPENRFMVPFGSDYVLQPGYSITVVYDSDALRWRVLA